MKECICGNTIEIESGQDVSYKNGFLMRTTTICLNCSYIDVSYYSMGSFLEGVDYENYEGSFENYDDKDELESFIEQATYLMKEKVD